MGQCQSSPAASATAGAAGDDPLLVMKQSTFSNKKGNSNKLSIVTSTFHNGTKKDSHNTAVVVTSPSDQTHPLTPAQEDDDGDVSSVASSSPSYYDDEGEDEGKKQKLTISTKQSLDTIQPVLQYHKQLVYYSSKQHHGENDDDDSDAPSDEDADTLPPPPPATATVHSISSLSSNTTFSQGDGASSSSIISTSTAAEEEEEEDSSSTIGPDDELLLASTTANNNNNNNNNKLVSVPIKRGPKKPPSTRSTRKCYQRLLLGGKNNNSSATTTHQEVVRSPLIAPPRGGSNTTTAAVGSLSHSNNLSSSSSSSVQFQTLHDFMSLKHQVSSRSKKELKEKKKAKYQDRLKDVQGYRQLWKDYQAIHDTINNNNSNKDHDHHLPENKGGDDVVVVEHTKEEGESFSKPPTTVVHSMGLTTAQSETTTTANNNGWYYDFRDMDYQESHLLETTQSQSKKNPHVLLTQEQIELQRQLFAAAKSKKTANKRSKMVVDVTPSSHTTATRSFLVADDDRSVVSDYGPIRKHGTTIMGRPSLQSDQTIISKTKNNDQDATPRAANYQQSATEMENDDYGVRQRRRRTPYTKRSFEDDDDDYSVSTLGMHSLVSAPPVFTSTTRTSNQKSSPTPASIHVTERSTSSSLVQQRQLELFRATTQKFHSNSDISKRTSAVEARVKALEQRQKQQTSTVTSRAAAAASNHNNGFADKLHAWEKKVESQKLKTVVSQTSLSSSAPSDELHQHIENAQNAVVDKKNEDNIVSREYSEPNEKKQEELKKDQSPIEVIGSLFQGWAGKLFSPPKNSKQEPDFEIYQDEPTDKNENTEQKDKPAMNVLQPSTVHNNKKRLSFGKPSPTSYNAQLSELTAEQFLLLASAEKYQQDEEVDALEANKENIPPTMLSSSSKKKKNRPRVLKQPKNAPKYNPLISELSPEQFLLLASAEKYQGQEENEESMEGTLVNPINVDDVQDTGMSPKRLNFGAAIAEEEDENNTSSMQQTDESGELMFYGDISDLLRRDTIDGSIADNVQHQVQTLLTKFREESSQQDE